MSLYRKIQSIKAQIISTQGLLETVKDHPLMSIGLVERINSLNQELEALPKVVSEAKVQLLFSGNAVVASQGIKSNFISKTLPPFQAMVKTQAAYTRFGDVGLRGKAKKAANSELYMTRLPTGSFGVELSQLQSNDLFDGIELSKAIKDVMTLVANATKDDESFESSVEKTPKRMLSNLKRFLQEIANEKSVLRMESGEMGIELTKEEIYEASLRVSSAVDDDEEMFVDAVFRGLLLDSGRFEIVDEEGREISGFIGSGLDEEELIKYNAFLNMSCVAHLRVIKTKFRTGNEKTEYELLEIKQRQNKPALVDSNSSF